MTEPGVSIQAIDAPVPDLPAIRPDSAGICPRCGATNDCAFSTGQAVENCWCMQQAPIASDGRENVPGQACWCAHCLQALAKALD